MAGPRGMPKPPGPPLAVAIALLVVGVLGAIGSFAVLGTAILHSVSDASALNGPGGEAVVCHSGTYLLYTRSGSNALDPSAVAITGPGGAAVPVEVETASQSITRFGTTYSGFLGFTATRRGTYTVRISASGVTLVVAPSLTNTFQRNSGWLIGAGVSLLTALVGLILLIVALVQRSGARKRAEQYVGAGWGAGQGGGWGPSAPVGPPGYGWTGSPGPQATGAPGWSPVGAPGAPNASGPWGPPAAPSAPPPGWTGGSSQPSGPASESDESSGQSSGWPQPSAKPESPPNS
jgi:hypothetical protein